jgi:hypothetical protein
MNAMDKSNAIIDQESRNNESDVLSWNCDGSFNEEICVPGTPDAPFERKPCWAVFNKAH